MIAAPVEMRPPLLFFRAPAAVPTRAPAAPVSGVVAAGAGVVAVVEIVVAGAGVFVAPDAGALAAPVVEVAAPVAGVFVAPDAGAFAPAGDVGARVVVPARGVDVVVRSGAPVCGAVEVAVPPRAVVPFFVAASAVAGMSSARIVSAGEVRRKASARRRVKGSSTIAMLDDLLTPSNARYTIARDEA